MAYLLPTDYANFGLSPDTTDDWILSASTLIDAHCRRASLSPTQYTERLRIVEGSQTVRLSYLPLVQVAPAGSPIVSASVRYARARRGELAYPGLTEVAWAFSIPGSWTTLDVASLDFVPETGELTFPFNIFGIPYNEVSVTYTAGLNPIPASVQAACAQIVRNAQSTPGLNVKSAKLDTMEMRYFSNTLLDEYVTSLLKPYVANRLG